MQPYEREFQTSVMKENKLEEYDLYSHMYTIRTMQFSYALQTIAEEAKFISSDYYMHLSMKKIKVDWKVIEKKVAEYNGKNYKQKMELTGDKKE